VQLAGNERIFLRAGEKSTLNLIFIKFRFVNICSKINESNAIKIHSRKRVFKLKGNISLKKRNIS
jgi:hypothetical protein